MNRATGAAIQGTTARSGQVHMQSADLPRLPRWEDLSPEYHHELVMVLSTIVAKRLSAQQEGKGEVTRE